MNQPHRIYPVPSEEILQDDFTMTLNGEKVPLHYARVSAYPINRRWPGHQRTLDQTELASFANFALAAEANVVLEPKEKFSKVTIRPLSKKIVPEIRGGKIFFTLPAGIGFYTVELDTPHHALHLFSDEMREFCINPEDSDVLYYGPGVHDAGVIKLKSNQTLYIDEGAVVFARITALDADNIRILGHGILDGSKNREEFLHELTEEDKLRIEKCMAVDNKREHTIVLQYCDHVLIDGITIRDSLVYNIKPIGCRDLTIRCVKIIGNWRYNSDGIDMHNCADVHIDSCFLRTFDDAICCKGFDPWMDAADMHRNGVDYSRFLNVLIENCVVWCDWGTCLEIGAETQAEEIAHITFRNCDLIRCQSRCCDVSNVDYALVHDVVFEDIRIELDGSYPGIYQKTDETAFDLNSPMNSYAQILSAGAMKHFEYSVDDPRMGINRDIVFRNISVTGKKFSSCSFYGGREDAVSGPIRIENLTFNGVRFKSLEEACVKIEGFIHDVTIL